MGFLRGSALVIDNGAAACEASVQPNESLGFNIDAGASCGFADTPNGDLQNQAAIGLGPLALNGGPTKTFGISSAPAVDHVPVADCLDANGDQLTTDQRGFSRPFPVGANCDAGALEAPVTRPVPPAPNSFGAQSAPPTPSAAKKCKKKKKKRKAAAAKKKGCKKKKKK
jgi:hypothetical protein